MCANPGRSSHTSDTGARSSTGSWEPRSWSFRGSSFSQSPLLSLGICSVFLLAPPELPVRTSSCGHHPAHPRGTSQCQLPSGALSLWSYISRRHLTMEFLFQSEAQSPCFRSSLRFGCTWARCSISSNQRAGGVGGPETQTSLTRPQPKHRVGPEPMCQGSRQSERQEIDV